jgi:hypothetical protein
MQPQIALKLLELTRQGRRRLKLAELEEHLNVPSHIMREGIAQLHGKHLVSLAEGLVEVDSRQRIMLAEELILHGLEPRKVSRFLEWQEFENFAAYYLDQNGFHTARHFVFKSPSGRREIDLLAWNDNFLFAIDCKHWARGLASTRLRKAAEAQLGRALALANRIDLLKKRGIGNPEGRSIIPVILGLGESRDRFVLGVPVVPVSKFRSFLGGVSPIDSEIRAVRIQSDPQQTVLG